MRVQLLIIKYKWWSIPFGLLSMALFRLPLAFSKNISFWRLMGSGKNGSFDLQPDLRQWAILMAYKPTDGDVQSKTHIPSFISNWIKYFAASTTCFSLEPIEGFGLWNGKEVFGKLPRQSAYDGKIAVLTRATIRPSQMINFWKNVPAVSNQMTNAVGLINSYGIGEWPFIKQATFSIWENKAAMKSFAYKMKEHQDVIVKTRKQNWYKEEMFVRFKILGESAEF